MAFICDVCKSVIPDHARFCPKCGLEFVPERERASRPPPLNKDVFDWGEPREETKEYDYSKKQQPVLDAERTAELLELAQTRLAEGQLVDASALLKQVLPQLEQRAELRGTVTRMTKEIETRKQAIRQRCDGLAETGDSNRLVALLTGQAANELEPEEICVVALAAARVLFQARHADGAADLLRLAPFRTLREETLIQEHRQLELQVHRMRARQHALKSFGVLASVMVVGALALTLFAIALWYGGMTLSLWILLPLAVIAPFLAANQRQLRQWWQTLKDRPAGRSRPAQKLQQFLRARRK